MAEYIYPVTQNNLLDVAPEIDMDAEKIYQETVSQIITDTLATFGIHVSVANISYGSRITRYTLAVSPGTTYGKIKARIADLQVALGEVVLSDPKDGIVLEIPSKQSRLVMTTNPTVWHGNMLEFSLGEYKTCNITCDLAKMPHLLIGGTTGSGKSVCVNTIITNLIARNHPDAVKFILIDPKQVELTAYKDIPNLLCPIITSPAMAASKLSEVCQIMDNRYHTLANAGYRNIDDYNKEQFRMPYIVVVIDELADLMLTSKASVEESIVRIAQKARACGIHLIVATQEPTVKVVTGLIKANMPSRIAFKTATSKESVVILGHGGAEKLLGKGDMIFQAQDSCTPIRVQGTYTSDSEINRIVNFIKSQNYQSVYNKPVAKSRKKLFGIF